MLNVYTANSTYDMAVKTDTVFTAGSDDGPTVKTFIIADKAPFCDPSAYESVVICITVGSHKTGGERPNSNQTFCGSIRAWRHLGRWCDGRRNSTSDE